MLKNLPQLSHMSRMRNSVRAVVIPTQKQKLTAGLAVTTVSPGGIISVCWTPGNANKGRSAAFPKLPIVLL